MANVPRLHTADDLFGERMKAVREVRGISQSKLAVKIGMPQTALSRIEAQKRSVSLTEALAIADGLHISLDEMIRPGAVQIATIA